MSLYVTCCFAYLSIALLLTALAASPFYRHSRMLLVEAFNGNSELANAVNRLLIAAFGLLNLGYIALTVTWVANAITAGQAVEQVSGKLGAVLMLLGITHFVSLFVLNGVRRRCVDRRQRPSEPAS